MCVLFNLKVKDMTRKMFNNFRELGRYWLIYLDIPEKREKNNPGAIIKGTSLG